MSTREFLDSDRNPVPMLSGESYVEYAHRLMASGMARQWEKAKDRWMLDRYRESLAARFGEDAANAHLNRVGIR